MTRTLQLALIHANIYPLHFKGNILYMFLLSELSANECPPVVFRLKNACGRVLGCVLKDVLYTAWCTVSMKFQNIEDTLTLIYYLQRWARGFRVKTKKDYPYWSNNTTRWCRKLSFNFPVKLMNWKSVKIIDSNNVLYALNRHVIKFSAVSSTSAPHFTLKFCDSITALVPVHLLGHLTGNWIGGRMCCNTRWGLLAGFLLCFSFKCVKKKKNLQKTILYS